MSDEESRHPRRIPRARWQRFAVITCLGAVLLLPPVYADTDVVGFVNGDRLTGEVKSLERGKLRFKTAATDTISIDWDNVASLASDQNIQVETKTGERYLGWLGVAQDTKRLVVTTDSAVVKLVLSDVVLMNPIEDKGFDRFDGDITAGYNFSKASEISQALFGLDLQARTEMRLFRLDISSGTTDSKDNESSQRHSLNLSYERLWPKRWLTGAVVRLDRNDELALDLRSSFGVGGGRKIRQTNNSTLTLVAGLQISRDNVSGGISDDDTVEAFTALAWDWFRYDAPELDLSTELQIIPNLTDSGRIRGEFDVSLKWEITEDMFWELAFYESYDSDPLVPGAERNDYGIVTSLGREF